MKNNFFLFLILSLWSCKERSDVPRPGLTYIWSGAPTDSSITIKFKTAGEQDARVHLHKNEDLSDTAASTDIISTSRETYYTGAASFGDLSPDKTYHYSLEVDNTAKVISGQFKTFPQGPSSFHFAFGSCATTGSNHPVFNTIDDMDPLFFMNIGDFHYENIKSNCSYNFARAFFANLNSHSQSRLYRSRPFIYVWDDHDFGPNNSAGDASCRDEALEAFRRFVPHYPLGLEGDDTPVSQAFVAGRVRFVLTDLRSHKERPEYDGCERTEEGTNFGTEEHLEWFQDQLLSAKESNQLVAWVNSIPWISDERSPKFECDEDDDWYGYEEERQRIADFIKENNIPIFILSGDGHMLAIDDGSNSDYATGGGAPIPVFHAAPLDQVGILKGGPYSGGYSRKWGQFGIVEVKDIGEDKICITFRGMNSEGNRAVNINGHPLVYTFCRDLSKRRPFTHNAL